MGRHKDRYFLRKEFRKQLVFYSSRLPARDEPSQLSTIMFVNIIT